MAILRTAKCSICGKENTEETYGDGWAGWGGVQGINFNGDTQPMLCPEHLATIANFMDSVKLNYEEGGKQ